MLHWVPLATSPVITGIKIVDRNVVEVQLQRSPTYNGQFLLLAVKLHPVCIFTDITYRHLTKLHLFAVQLIDAVKDLRRAIPGADDISPEMDQLALAGRFESLGTFHRWEGGEKIFLTFL